MGLRSFVFAFALLLFGLLVYVQKPDDEVGRATDGLLVITLVNFIVVVICVLAFLIGRNVVKLIFDRKRGILGSQLRGRLVVALVGLTLIPTGILFFSASGLLARAMEGWFSSTVENAVGGAVDIARRHHNFIRDYQAEVLAQIRKEVGEAAPGLSNPEMLRQFLEVERKRWKLFSIRVVAGDASVIVSAEIAVAQLDSFREPELDRDTLIKALGGETEVRFEEFGSSQFIRAYGPIDLSALSSLSARPPLAVVSTYRISPELSQTLTNVSESFREYEQLKLFRGGLRSNYLLTLALITGLLLFSAIWLAFYIARELAGPIQRVADATSLVAKGRDDVQLPDIGGDEMGQLVRAFNSMTTDLRRSRQERERHRAYLETLLQNLAVGVIGVDRERTITSINPAAAETFGISRSADVLGKKLSEVLPHDEYGALSDLIAEVEGQPGGNAGERVSECELMVRNHGRELKVICTVGQIIAAASGAGGYALLFDDVTELSKAQHLAAWREAAQRIAHEIKNPLTPIQLSAQRLEKLVSDEQLSLKRSSRGVAPEEVELHAKITESAQTIVEHVASIKRLANEFSQFARMPPAEFAPTDLNKLIAQAIEPFAHSQSDILIQFISDGGLPEVLLDREQIRRVVINLIDNALSAIQHAREAGTVSVAEAAKITIRTNHQKGSKLVSFEVADTGPGISSPDKLRIFEPYVTTKKGGTGLGLAIVTAIVSEHQGSVRVFDNTPSGARFVVELPVRPQRVTQRRFSL